MSTTKELLQKFKNFKGATNQLFDGKGNAPSTVAAYVTDNVIPPLKSMLTQCEKIAALQNNSNQSVLFAASLVKNTLNCAAAHELSAVTHPSVVSAPEENNQTSSMGFK